MMKLYGHWRSQAAMRVRIALALKGIPHEEVSIDILGGGQFDPAYLALNPEAVVPTLEDGAGPPLVQSLAILEWLEEMHPMPPLLPPEARGRARVRALALICAADAHPLVVPSGPIPASPPRIRCASPARRSQAEAAPLHRPRYTGGCFTQASPASARCRPYSKSGRM